MRQTRNQTPATAKAQLILVAGLPHFSRERRDLVRVRSGIEVHANRMKLSVLERERPCETPGGRLIRCERDAGGSGALCATGDEPEAWRSVGGFVEKCLYQRQRIRHRPLERATVAALSGAAPLWRVEPAEVDDTEPVAEFFAPLSAERAILRYVANAALGRRPLVQHAAVSACAQRSRERGADPAAVREDDERSGHLSHICVARLRDPLPLVHPFVRPPRGKLF